MIYIGSSRNPTSSLKEVRVRVSRSNALKFLWGCKNGERGDKTYARREAAWREAPGALLLRWMDGAVENEEWECSELWALAALI
jgi:hypothetical protein